MLQIFNLEMALKVTDNDNDLLQEIIQMFKSEKMTLLNAVSDGIQSKNLDKIKTSGHSIKGTLVTIGAEICADLAFQIENTKTTEEIPTAKVLLKTLKSEIEKFIIEAKEKLKTVNQ